MKKELTVLDIVFFFFMTGEKSSFVSFQLIKISQTTWLTFAFYIY